MASDLKMKKRDYRFFEFARKQAERADYKNIYIGCVITYKNHVIGRGFNKKKTCPTQKKANKYRPIDYDKIVSPIVHSVHAEIAAYRSIPYPLMQSINLSQCNVYIYRICRKKDLGIGMSRPCEGCMKFLRNKGFQNIYYTTEDGFVYERVL